MSYHLTLDIPDDVASDLIAEAAQRNITIQEVVAERLWGVHERSEADRSVTKEEMGNPLQALRALRKNPGFADFEEAHRHLQELRDEWK